MDDAKQQLVDKLKSANNILVTVSRNPTVDQLASCLGLALTLNKQGKHTAAVFSGEVPSTLEFLQPEDTIEKNTDSLRDFIIALDKSKADKLRYKVEDNVVRIFITPYKTSISQEDFDFSQGDFNVDVLIALGVGKQEDLDEAITAHGRILHDATVASINITPEGGLGSINWHDSKSSSLSEMVTELTQSLDPMLMDTQIATALLTGIVSATNRFSNDKTSSQTMSVSATLMAAGANQQLVASKLEEPPAKPSEPVQEQEDSEHTDSKPSEKPPADGTLEIEHSPQTNADTIMELPAPKDNDLPPDESNDANSDTSDVTSLPTPPPLPPNEDNTTQPSSLSPGSRLMTGPPTMGGTLTANTQPEGLDPVTDPFSLPNAEANQLLERKPDTSSSFTPPPLDWSSPETSSPSTAPTIATPSLPIPPPVTPLDLVPPSDPASRDGPALFPPAPVPMPMNPRVPNPSAQTASITNNGAQDEKPKDDIKLDELEEQIKQSEQQAANDASSEAAGLDNARDEVDRALNTATSTLPPQPIEALNAQPLLEGINTGIPTTLPGPVSLAPPTVNPLTTPLPTNDLLPPLPSPGQLPLNPRPLPPEPIVVPQVADPTAPPPVPPPIPFQFGNTNSPQ
jgi:hypothetical protein